MKSLKRRILIVDDWRQCADSLALVFRLSGHEVETAYDGIAALEAARRFQPEVVFLDLTMPRMDGFDAGRALCFLSPRPYLVAVTASGSEQDRRRTLEAGFDEHLVKPVDPEVLEGLLVRLTGSLAPRVHRS